MNNKTLTVKELIARKQQLANKGAKKQTLYIKSLDANITIQQQSREVYLDAMDMGAAGDSYVVYNAVIEPKLKDKELQEAYGCTEPMDIVFKIFEPGEIPQIAMVCAELAGFGNSVKVVEEIKN